MNDIFISYSTEDRSIAKVIADELEQHGLSVWWDRTILPGESFDEVIEEALDSTKCVIVLWSKKSVSSDWVRNEAEEGRRRRILVPALIEEVTIPLAFRRIQAANLLDWRGQSKHREFDKLLKAIAKTICLNDLPKREKKISSEDEFNIPKIRPPKYEPLPKYSPVVYICHVSEDIEVASNLYEKLNNEGLKPWLDNEKLKGGDRWDMQIKRVINEEIDYFVVLVSRAMEMRKEGFFYIEINTALRRQRRFSSRFRFIIPVIIEDCKLLEMLEDFQAIDLSDEYGFMRLVETIKRDNEIQKKM